MFKTYLNRLDLPCRIIEEDFICSQRRTCYSNFYPFKIFPEGLETITFSPITIMYGGNGSGKSTLLNIIAEKLGVIRHSAFNGGAFFKEYLKQCNTECGEIPEKSQILTSDDVFDFMLNVRYLNDGIDYRREELFEDWLTRKYAEHKLKSMADYEDWKESYDAKTKSQSKYVKERLMRNVDMHSNGESALKYFVDHITEDALYLLDEPENSLAINLQQELSRYIYDSAMHYNCQFVIATHSPILLAMKDTTIYDLDARPVTTRIWTELENIRMFYEFFESHRDEFSKAV